MSEIYVYAADCKDFSNFGLVGALTPTSCVFEEVANGMSEITLEHPIDTLGRYTQLVANNLLMVDVPVRTTPEINNGNIVTSVEKWNVNKTASKANRTMYKKRSVSDAKKDVKIRVIPAGTSVTVVSNDAAYDRVKIKCKYGTGWISRSCLESKTTVTIADNSQSIESVEPAWTVKPQLFRIYNVEKGIAGISVMARHISYDLMFNLTTYKNNNSVTCKDALAGIMDKCIADHEFDAYTNLTTARTGVDWTRKNPIDAILNPENGLTARYGASLVRDNWEMYVLHDPGLNRGVTVEYGKNMTGITYIESFENVVTRIVPVGETKDGKPLLLSGDTPWVDSTRINNYPVVYAQELICENCKVTDDVDSTAKARAEMRKQAEAVFENGGDLPTVEMSVQFISLGDTAEYAQYKDLERLFLWDYVIVRHKLHNIDVTARIVSIRWDCMLERMESMEIGSVGKTLANSGITSWQIPTGISGSKIASGTIGATSLGDGIISANHIQTRTINAENIAAKTLTANEIASNTITAENMKAGTLDADIIKAVAAHLGNVNADTITTDQLYAALAEFNVLAAGTADFDVGAIKHLLSEALVLQAGQAGSMMITNLAVTSANMLNATIGELVLKGDDGLYYRVHVGSDGTIHTETVTLSEGEIEAGQTSAGNQIVSTAANIGALNAQSIKGQSAIIDTIVTTALTAGKITATEALIASASIPTLYTTAIKAIGDTLDLSANKTIQFVVGEVNKKSETYRQDDMPNGAANGDLWVQPETGYTYQFSSEDIPDNVLPELHIDEDGNLTYEFTDGQATFELFVDENGNLAYSGTTYVLAIDDNGVLYVTGQWRRVIDEDAYAQIGSLQTSSLSKAEFQRFVRLDAEDGMVIGRSDSSSALVLTESGVAVNIGGVPYSRFAANYVQFGDYQIRRSAKGALVFKLASGGTTYGLKH